MRWAWVIAGLLMAAAVAALAWTPRGAEVPAVEGSATPFVCPMPPALPADPAPKAPPSGSAALDSLLGGSLVTPASGAAGTTGVAEVTVGQKAMVERLPDGSMRIDGRYTVRGAGTETDPYQVTWELLGSAADSVDAAQHRYVIPGRIADLRGAWVRISGFWAPPLQVFEAKEAMLMLNKWDGCCIGRPPTPFDSIEATFAHPVQVKGMHVFRYGTFRGRLTVEPYVAGTFLLGIYRLEDVVMESSS